MSTISWGRRERYAFASGGQLLAWAPPVTPAVYAVTYQRDPRNKPKGHTVLLFGESPDLSSNFGHIRRNVAEAWTRQGGSAEELFIFFHPMDGSTALDRSRVLERLVLEYQPDGNRSAE